MRYFPSDKVKINKIFKIIGAAADKANLLCEFNIAAKNDDKLTNNKNGNVILVKKIVISNFSIFSLKPGAIRITNQGIKISIINTKTKSPINSKLKMSPANFSAFFLPFTN